MPQMRGSGTGLALAGLSAAAFSTSGPLGRALTSAGWSPGAAVAVRAGAAAVLLAVPAALSLRGRWRELRRNAGLAAAFGLLAVAGCQVSFFNAVQHLPVGMALQLEYLAPVLVAGWLWARHGQRPGRATVAGSALALLGLLLALGLTSDHQADLPGIAWALAAAAGLAAYFVLSARTAEGLPAAALASTGMGIGAIALTALGVAGALPMHAAFGTVTLGGHRTSWLVPAIGLAVVATAAAECTGIAAARTLGARLASFAALSEVVFAVLAAWLLLGQRPALTQLAGGILILAGVAAVHADVSPRTARAPQSRPRLAVPAPSPGRRHLTDPSRNHLYRYPSGETMIIKRAHPTATARQLTPVWTLVLASAAAFMACVDTMVVTTALPVLRVSLQGTLADLEWTVNAYNLAFACLLLTGAALGDRFGRRRIFCTGLAAFTAASAAAALSPTAGALIAARAVQGAAAALVLPLTLTLISDAFPPEKRGRAIGVWGGVIGLGGAVGPVIGGAVAGGLSWQWIFWLNVPVGAALIPLAAFRLHESHGPSARLDVIGLLLAGAGFLGLTWALVHTGNAGWASGQVTGPLAAGAVLIGLFAWWEHRTPSPMLPLRMFRHHRFVAANGVSFLLYASLFGAVFLMAQFFQSAQHMTSLQAGIRLLGWTSPGIVVAPVAGRLAERYGNRPFMAAGLLLHAGGLAWIAAIASPSLGFPRLVLPLVISGIGVTLVLPTVANEAVTSIAGQDVGIASGANTALRELGGVFGVAVLASVFSRAGAYASPAVFADGFKAALWAGVIFAVAGFLFTAPGLQRARQPGQPGAPGPGPLPISDQQPAGHGR